MVDNILTSCEFHNSLKNLHNLMGKSKQHLIETIYQKFQIDNFVIDQIFKLEIGGIKIEDRLILSGVITLTNYFYITVLPCNYRCKTEIDELVFDTSYEFSISHCKYTYSPNGYVAHHGEFSNTDLDSIRNFMYDRNVYTYSLLHIKPAKMMNFIDLISVKFI